VKIYERADEPVFAWVAELVKKYHPDLVSAGVSIDVLMVEHDDPDNENPAISHRGYPAAAQVRAVPVKDRAGGRRDAEILVDKRLFKTLPEKRKQALLDHELQHLQPVLGKEQRPKLDGAGRPRLKLRRHDRQLGWFDAIVRRHGEAAPEKVQARALLQEAGQLYFDFPGGGAGVQIVPKVANN